MEVLVKVCVLADPDLLEASRRPLQGHWQQLRPQWPESSAMVGTTRCHRSQFWCTCMLRPLANTTDAENVYMAQQWLASAGARCPQLELCGHRRDNCHGRSGRLGAVEGELPPTTRPLATSIPQWHDTEGWLGWREDESVIMDVYDSMSSGG